MGRLWVLGGMVVPLGHQSPRVPRVLGLAASITVPREHLPSPGRRCEARAGDEGQQAERLGMELGAWLGCAACRWAPRLGTGGDRGMLSRWSS